MRENFVFIEKNSTFSYPKAPFNPQQSFPELGNLNYAIEADGNNQIYGYVRDVLKNLNLDSEYFGTKEWKPFKDLIKPGQHVVIKPNFIKGNHSLGVVGVQSMITHASVIRPIIDYVLLSTNNDCRITICDVPLQSSVWEEIIELSGAQALVDFYKQHNILIRLLDLRREISHLNEELVINKRNFADRDPLGYTAVDLGPDSALMPVIKYHKQFMVTDYDKGTVSKHHNPERNEYCIAKTILDADLFINIPKLKTHRKAGITVAAKNLVGINGDKRWIAHHREGSIKFGGDEFPRYVLKDWLEFRLFSFLKRYPPVGIWFATKIRKYHRLAFEMKNKVFIQKRSPNTFCRKVPNMNSEEIGPLEYIELYPQKPRYLEGSWYGNDTIWRTISDLNQIIFYADREGKITDTIQRSYFCLVDGILAGENEGPMEHTPKKAGVIIGGFHPLTVDFASAKIMGFDYRKIPSIYRILKNKRVNYANLNGSNIVIKSNVNIETLNLMFQPTINWKGHIEAD